MSRVRLLNASLIASADLPILPLLAPRVFTTSLVSRRSKHKVGKNDGAQKEKEGMATYKETPRTERCRNQSQNRPRILESTCGLQLRQHSPVVGLLQLSRPRWDDAKQTAQLRHIGPFYADLYSFARQHARTYSTTKRAIRRVPSRIKPSQRRGRGTRPARTSSILAQHGPLLAAKREKALALEQRRLDNYASRLPAGLSAANRLQQGQYRSLSRRVCNLKNWDATRLNLQKITGGSSNGVGLVRAFAALDRGLYASIKPHTRRVILHHDPRCVRWSVTLFPSGTRVRAQKVWRRWMDFDIETRMKCFQKLLVYMLDRKPGRALRFIQVLASDPLLRGRRTEYLADALGHLSKIHSRGVYAPKQEWSLNAEANKRRFVAAFVLIFNKALAGKPDVCSQDLLYNIVGLAGIEDLKKVFDSLVNARTRLGFDTLLHYANAFGEAGEVEYAIRCLDELRARQNALAWQSLADRERLRWTCALILRQSMRQSQNFHETPGIVASFVRLGIKMDILLYNVVMHNAMEASDYATAFKLYNALESNGLKPDKHTFSILLRGCTLQSNPAVFQSFAQHCAEVAKEIKDPWLATDYLYYLYVCRQNDPDIERTSAVLWQTYLSFFSGSSLEPLISPARRNLMDLIDKQPFRLELAVHEPTSTALYIMLQTEIRLALAVSNQRVLKLYHRFKLLSSNIALKPLTQNPISWNAFLFAFCQKQQFASASQVIKDMTDSSPQPNVYSWNIFMQAFFKTGQVEAAERVFEIMRSRGVEPDQFSYGVLLRGYAKAQLVERIGHTMLHVGSEQEMDADLLRALGRVVNRRELMLTLEKSRLEKEARAQEKADRDAEEERERWEPMQFPSMPLDQDPIDDHLEPEFDDDHGSSFLQEETTVPQELPPDLYEPSTTPFVSQAATSQSREPDVPSVSPPPAAKVNPYDPELQYRRLQGQLGITSPNSSNDAQTPAPEPLSFKSLFSAPGESRD